MKKISKFIAVLLVAAMLLSLAACGGSGSSTNSGTTAATDDTVYTIKIGGQWADSAVHSRMFLECFIPEIESKSNGRIKCEWYGNNATGNEMDQLTQIQMNELQLAILSDQSATIDPAHLLLPFLPFLFESEAQWDAVFEGEIGQEIVAGMVNSGVRCLGFDENGFRVITNNVRPIYTAADCKGLKMRVTSSDMYIALFNALGCSCMAMTLGEAYSALETGACDGQDNAYNTIKSANLNEVQKYISDTNHVLGTMYVCTSEAFYQSLPADLQQLLADCVKEACDWEHKEYRDAAASDLKALIDAGMEYNQISDLQSFKDATASVYDDFFAKYPETKAIVEKIQALAK